MTQNFSYTAIFEVALGLPRILEIRFLQKIGFLERKILM